MINPEVLIYEIDVYFCSLDIQIVIYRICMSINLAVLTPLDSLMTDFLKLVVFYNFIELLFPYIFLSFAIGTFKI